MESDLEVIEEVDGELLFVHYSDAYKAASQKNEPVGGAARFVSAWRACTQGGRGVVTCGGDVFNPSLLSTVTKGKHVPPLIKLLQTRFSCVGNHDLDFGCDAFADLAAATSPCRWLLSNVRCKGAFLRSTTQYCVCVTKPSNRRVGIIGLAGTDFFSTLNFDSSQFSMEEPVTCAKRLREELINTHGCDVIVALTHMRSADDERLVEAVPDLLVLGAHDHEVMERPVPKCGTDWQHIVLLRYNFETKQRSVKIVPVTSAYAPDELVAAEVNRWQDVMEAGNKKVIATLLKPFDLRTSLIRVAEAPVSNWIADLVLHEFETVIDRTAVDCVLINCGTFRGDGIVEAGPYSIKDLLSMLPFEDLMLAYRCPGRALLQAFESAFSRLPRENGGFPSINKGVVVHVDITRPSGHRVVSCKLGDKELVGGKHDDEKFVLVTKTFLAEGKDGFDCLKGIEPIMDPECALLLSSLVRNHLWKERVLNMIQTPKPSIEKRFLDKLRKRETYLPKIDADIDGRIVITK